VAEKSAGVWVTLAAAVRFLLLIKLVSDHCKQSYYIIPSFSIVE